METFRSLYNCLSLMDIVCLKMTSMYPSGVLDGRPNYANITFSELFDGPCVDRPEVMDEGLDYATVLSKFCARDRCPPMLVPSRVVAAEV